MAGLNVSSKIYALVKQDAKINRHLIGEHAGYLILLGKNFRDNPSASFEELDKKTLNEIRESYEIIS